MAPISQDNRTLKATTPLGGDVFVAVALTGVEEVSRPFLFTVDFVSTERSVLPDRLLGKPMTLHLPLAGGSERVVHGLVRRFVSLGRAHGDELSRYRVEVVPALWFLSLWSDCRTFENQSVVDIVEHVCKRADLTNLKRHVASMQPSRPYVVQYRESNLAFISRLLEGAGLFYTFDHAKDKHTFVISDARGDSIPRCATASVKVQPELVAGQAQAGVIHRLTREYAAHSASVSLHGHNLLRADDGADAPSTSPGARGTAYDFVGDSGDLASPDSQAESKRRIELEETGHDVFHGASTCPAFQSGTRVRVSGGILGTAETELHLLRVTHRLEIGDVIGGSGLSSTYENEFVAVPVRVPYRPARVTPRPSVRGTQLATITGSGDIDVDKYGRVLLRFPWDSGGGLVSGEKYRVHVASAWAGTGWGFIQHPRVNQEVLVEYLEGDPDRPIVTGRVYNSSNKPPYDLPANKTQAGWKSRTVGGGSDNFNELRFEDKKGEEHVYAQAEKDLKVLVKNDETRDVQHDRITTVKNDETRTVTEGNDTHTVKKGNQKVEVSEGDQTITVGKGKQTITVQADQAITVKQGNRSVTVEMGNDTLKVEKGNLSVDVSLGNITIKAGVGSIAIEALKEISLKVGPSSVVLSPTGVEIKGLNVKAEATVQAEVKGVMTKIEGSAMTQVKAPMTQVNGDGMVMVKGGVTMIN